MLRSRVGWKTVTAIVLFLFLRAIASAWVELSIAQGEGAALRVIAVAVWAVVLVGLALGVELCRFVSVIALVIGSVIALIVLIEPEYRGFHEGDPYLQRLKTYALVSLVSNVPLILLLAFSKPVRSFFSKMPSAHFRPY
jgi:ABC-type amino acid transport system permease subunit